MGSISQDLTTSGVILSLGDGSSGVLVGGGDVRDKDLKDGEEDLPLLVGIDLAWRSF